MQEPKLEDAETAVRILLDHYRAVVIPGMQDLADPEDHMVEVSLIARSAPLVEAILRLAEEGFGREALMLNRPLFELLLDSHWAGVDPELANERFLAHARFTQHLQRGVFRRYPELGISIREESLSAEEIKSSTKLFGKHADKSWTAMTVHQRVKHFEKRLSEDEQRQLWFAFEVLHDLANAELHPSSWSLGRGLRRVPGTDSEIKLQFRSSSEPELASFALTHTWWIFLRQLDLMHDLLGELETRLQEAADRGAKLLALE